MGNGFRRSIANQKLSFPNVVIGLPAVALWQAGNLEFAK
jgi:hypothetical protein